MKLRLAVNKALSSLTLTPSDHAAAELARHQAQAIDEGAEDLHGRVMLLLATQGVAPELLREIEPKLRSLSADTDALRKLGPHLLETLAELGMTPKARQSLTKGKAPDGNRGKLAELRSLRP